MSNRPVRTRPALFRALGPGEPPRTIEIAGTHFDRVEIFKHDSWAATARYRGPGSEVVCKFNRIQPIFGLPMTWLGRLLARREALALETLADVAGIPAPCGPIAADGRRLDNAVGHRYLDGHPLAAHDRPGDDFFPELIALLAAVHHRGMAYVDLHKRENIVVGDDGKPYLIDFQVYFGLLGRHVANRPLLRTILSALQRADTYHLAKHIRRHRPDQMHLLDAVMDDRRPWWIEVHRAIAAPLRQLRRRFLAALGVRGRGGRAVTEAFPEDAVRRELAKAA